MRHLSILLMVLLTLGLPAWGQQQVTTIPGPVGSPNSSGTIAVTNTFQSVLVAAGPAGGTRLRQGCLIQNNGLHTMYVFFGPIANATLNNSFELVSSGTTVAGNAISCSTAAGGVTQDQVSITGTATESFTAVSN